MLKNLQKPLLQLNWGGLPSLPEKEKGELFCYYLANLTPFQDFKPHNRCNQSEEGSSPQRILGFRPEPYLYILRVTVHTTRSAQRWACSRGGARCRFSHGQVPFTFYLFSFRGLLLTLSFTPV